jgi:hypothetical protein
MESSVRACSFHSDRPAVGICMRCRVPICAACSTRLGGINHCHACLKALGAKPEDRHGGLGWWAVTAACLLGAAWLALVGLCWAVSGRMAP